MKSHPADSIKTADGVSIRDLVPPVYVLGPHDQIPAPRESVGVNTILTRGERELHSWVVADGQSVHHTSLYQSQAAAWRELADRRRKLVDEALQEAAKAEAGGAA